MDCDIIVKGLKDYLIIDFIDWLFGIHMDKSLRAASLLSVETEFIATLHLLLQRPVLV